MNCTIFDKAADFLPDECFRTPPDLAIILGSGWGEALVADRTLLNLSYADIPGFGAATVVGHAGAARAPWPFPPAEITMEKPTLPPAMS